MNFGERHLATGKPETRIDIIHNRLASGFNIESNQDRLLMWKSAWQGIQDHFWLGIGFEKDAEVPEQDIKFDRDGFFKLLGKFLEGEGLSTDWETLQQADNELLINSLSMMLDFDLEDKQALLEAPSLETRRETLTTLFEFSLRGGSDDEVLQ